MEGLSSLTSSVLTAVKSRTILVVHVSVLGVGWAILQHVYLIRFIFASNLSQLKYC